MANANVQYTNLQRQHFLGQFVNVCLFLLGFAWFCCGNVVEAVYCGEWSWNLTRLPL
ncbi:MAG: hypothetical protein ABFQ95_06610 [Pseudomonadota bacterium]